MPEQTTLTLTPTPPFCFAHTLDFIRAFYARDYERVPASEQVVGDTLQRLVSVLGQAVLFRVRAVGAGLELTLHAERSSPELVAAATDRVRFYLSLDEDLGPFYANSDPIFAGVVDALHGYHPLKVLTPFEAACWALVQQRTPNAFAHASMARLSERFGPGLEHAGRLHRAFPEARAMLGEHAGVLTATNNTRKTERLLDLARAFAGVDESFLRAAPYGEVAKWFLSIKGVGAWSLDFFMVRGLGRYERAPWTDTGLLEAVSRVYTGGFAISAGAARELAERYGWQQGLWAHYLKVYAYR